MSHFTGKHFQSLLTENNFSLSEASEKLGISLDVLKSYFTYEKFERQHFDEILTKLNLGKLINSYYIISADEKIDFLKSIIMDLKKAMLLMQEIMIDQPVKQLLKEELDNTIAGIHKRIDII